MKLRVMVFCVLLVVLAACSGSISEADAEKALRAGFEGDAGTANKYICDKDQIEEGATAVPEGTSLEDIKCEKDGDQMVCTLSFAAADLKQTLTTTFTIRDGKLCDPEIDMPVPQ